MARKVTPEVLSKIKQWEGLKLKPYRDIAGVWTDGYGNTNGVVPNGPEITLAKAEADLRRNLATAEAAVDRLVKVALSDNQFGALVSFVFNVGVTAFAGSTLLRVLNLGDYAAVPAQMARWNKITANGKKVVSKGLANRRAAEIGLWASGAFVASADVEVKAPARLTQSTTMQGAAVTTAGTVGAALTDASNQVAVVADYSDTLRLIFIVVTLLGIGLTIYGRLRLRREDGV